VFVVVNTGPLSEPLMSACARHVIVSERGFTLRLIVQHSS